ncbi:integrase core domain-containing protein [Acrocarpospora catenulata]|uniref:integrase core domain-containing protein n=1 Tax=Acrocarpospora catenulata TaxID=2836182 RepID=UPI001BDA2E26|nr:integrase core domain-containing protein [Acrocarpospora catenulata]
MTTRRRITGLIVRDTFRQAVAVHGVPASTLTDNGMVFTTRLAGGRGGRNALEHELRRLHVTQKNSTPNHPTTCGKVERFQQTMKKWLRAQPAQPATITSLQTLLDRFVDAYNHRRPHRSLPPATLPQRSTTPGPKHSPPPAATPTPTPGSATTASMNQEWSPCGSAAGSITSASDEPTPEPTSSCSSPISTSESSPPPPENSSAS